jgi:hypothetical protein
MKRIQTQFCFGRTSGADRCQPTPRDKSFSRRSREGQPPAGPTPTPARGARTRAVLLREVTVQHPAVSPVFEGPNSFLEIACFSSRCRGSCARLEACKGDWYSRCGMRSRWRLSRRRGPVPRPGGDRGVDGRHSVRVGGVRGDARQGPGKREGKARDPPSHLRNGSGRASPGPRVAIMRTRVG